MWRTKSDRVSSRPLRFQLIIGMDGIFVISLRYLLQKKTCHFVICTKPSKWCDVIQSIQRLLEYTACREGRKINAKCRPQHSGLFHENQGLLIGPGWALLAISIRPPNIFEVNCPIPVWTFYNKISRIISK